MTINSELIKIGREAKKAARYMRMLSTDDKNKILLACADALENNTAYIIEENKKDMERLDKSRKAFADRLMLNESRIKGLATGLRKVSALDDPVGEILYMRTMPNGLQIGEQRTPLGVVGMIYEARPNVTADAFGLCVKSGNACILRGGSEAINSHMVVVKVLHDTLIKLNHPETIVQLIEDTSREVAAQFMKLNEYVDVLIPRGGAGLINSTVQNSTIPVIETGIGNCHIFVDESADSEKAVPLIINAKTQRPSVCNSCEKLLVHKAVAESFLPVICNELASCGVEIRGDAEVCRIYPKAAPASEDDWYEEYVDLIIAVKVVNDIDEAIEHIGTYSSGHTEAILTENYNNMRKFTNEVDSAAVFVNASTRFTDGEEFGLGAEMGISTQKLHVRGPMGLKALTSTKFVGYGNGHIRK